MAVIIKMGAEQSVFIFFWRVTVLAVTSKTFLHIFSHAHKHYETPLIAWNVEGTCENHFV